MKHSVPTWLAPGRLIRLHSPGALDAHSCFWIWCAGDVRGTPVDDSNIFDLGSTASPGDVCLVLLAETRCLPITDVNLIRVHVLVGGQVSYAHAPSDVWARCWEAA